MRVLVITEKLDKNDEKESFFHGRLLDFAHDCKKLTVMVLENKAHSLPATVEVISLGKEKKISKFGYMINFYKYIFKHASDYDMVFVHRNPVYIILGGLFWRLMGKNITLWYNHSFVDWKLRLSMLFVDNVLSSSLQSFPIKTKKLKVVDGKRDLDCYVCHVKST